MTAYRVSLVVALLFGLCLQVAMYLPLTQAFTPGCADDNLIGSRATGWICLEDLT